MEVSASAPSQWLASAEDEFNAKMLVRVSDLWSSFLKMNVWAGWGTVEARLSYEGRMKNAHTKANSNFHDMLRCRDVLKEPSC